MISSFFAPKTKAVIASPRCTTSSAKEVSKRSNRQVLDNDNDCISRKRPKLSEVDQLLSDLTDVGENEGGENDENSRSWRQALARHTSSSSFQTLAVFIQRERSRAIVYPPSKDTFTALNWTPMSSVKVVIVGQDPYHNPNEAHGLCFSVRQGIPIPPSLRNIYKELASDPDVAFPNKRGMPRHGYLERWARQGVLMLNNVLTVRENEPNSHRKKGWEAFTDHVIRTLILDAKDRDRGIVFLLWGKPASEKAVNIIGHMQDHLVVIQTSHPSPLGATKTNAPFLGSKCFSRANEALKRMNLDPIDWNVDDEK